MAFSSSSVLSLSWSTILPDSASISISWSVVPSRTDTSYCQALSVSSQSSSMPCTMPSPVSSSAVSAEEFSDDRVETVHARQVPPDGRFIEQQHARVCDQRRGDDEILPPGHVEVERMLLGHGGQADVSQHVVHHGSALLADSFPITPPVTAQGDCVHEFTAHRRRRQLDSRVLADPPETAAAVVGGHLCEIRSLAEAAGGDLARTRCRPIEEADE